MIKFVSGNPNKYLVLYEMDGELCEPVIQTANEIFDKMDMADCYDISVHYMLGLYDKDRLPVCEFHGTWCCKNPETGKIDSLRMEIREKNTGEVVDVGYGTDH